MNILNVLKKKDKPEIIHHVVLVEAPLVVVGSQLKIWFNNDWWSQSKVAFKAVSSDAVEVGSKFVGRFKNAWPVKWQADVVQFNPNTLLRSSISGFFKGTETISLEERFHAIKVNYHLDYEIKNPFNQMAWSIFLEERFSKEMRKGLEGFKANCEKTK